MAHSMIHLLVEAGKAGEEPRFFHRRLTRGIGSLGRDTVRTPGELDLDLAVGREFPIAERLRFKLRAEAVNVLNHTNLLTPTTSLTVTSNTQGQPIFNSPGFGIITAARAARFLQLIARFEF